MIEALTGKHSADPLRILGIRQTLGRVDAPATDDLFQQTEVLLAAIFHATSEPMLVTRAEDSLIVEINDAAVRETGYQQDEIRGRREAELKLWTDARSRDQLVKRALATRQPQHGELTMLTRSGDCHPVRGRFQAIDLRNSVTTFVCPTRPWRSSTTVRTLTLCRGQAPQLVRGERDPAVHEREADPATGEPAWVATMPARFRSRRCPGRSSSTLVTGCGS